MVYTSILPLPPFSNQSGKHNFLVRMQLALTTSHTVTTLHRHHHAAPPAPHSKGLLNCPGSTRRPAHPGRRQPCAGMCGFTPRGSWPGSTPVWPPRAASSACCALPGAPPMLRCRRRFAAATRSGPFMHVGLALSARVRGGVGSKRRAWRWGPGATRVVQRVRNLLASVARGRAVSASLRPIALRG